MYPPLIRLPMNNARKDVETRPCHPPTGTLVIRPLPVILSGAMRSEESLQWDSSFRYATFRMTLRLYAAPIKHARKDVES